MTKNNLQIKIANIADANEDVIVVPCSNYIKENHYGSGVDGAIFKRFPELKKKWLKYRRKDCPPGTDERLLEPNHCFSINSDGKTFIFIVSMIKSGEANWSNYDDNLIRTYWSVFNLAGELGYRRIAMPLLGTGGAGWKPEESFGVCRTYCDNFSNFEFPNMKVVLYIYPDKTHSKAFDFIKKRANKIEFLEAGLDFYERKYVELVEEGYVRQEGDILMNYFYDNYMNCKREIHTVKKNAMISARDELSRLVEDRIDELKEIGKSGGKKFNIKILEEKSGLGKDNIRYVRYPEVTVKKNDRFIPSKDKITALLLALELPFTTLKTELKRFGFAINPKENERDAFLKKVFSEKRIKSAKELNEALAENGFDKLNLSRENKTQNIVEFSKFVEDMMNYVSEIQMKNFSYRELSSRSLIDEDDLVNLKKRSEKFIINRDKVIAICLGMNCKLEELEEALDMCGYCLLDEPGTRDAAIRKIFQHDIYPNINEIIDVNYLLEDLGFDPIISGNRQKYEDRVIEEKSDNRGKKGSLSMTMD